MSEGKLVFVSDPAFCPLCGTILPLPSASDKVCCEVCKHSQDTARFEGLEEYSCKYFTPRKEKLQVSQQGSGPLVERRCPACGNEEMTYTTQQTRSADEGQTVFYTCPRCKFKETENS